MFDSARVRGVLRCYDAIDHVERGLSHVFFPSEGKTTSKKRQSFHRHSRWLYIQQQSSSSSSNRFIEQNDCWKTKNSVVERQSFCYFVLFSY